MPLHAPSSVSSSVGFSKSSQALFSRAMMLKATAPPKPKSQDDLKDGDGDGVIFDGTPQERPAPQKGPEQKPAAEQQQNPGGQLAPKPAAPKAAAPSPAQPPAKTPTDDLNELTKSEKLFDEKELKLGRGAKQPAKTQQELYDQARKAIATFSQALDHGQGVDKAIGGKSIYPESSEQFDQAIDDAISSATPLVIIGKLKGEQRAAEKVQAKYGGDWGKLRDVVRGTIAIPSARMIPETVAALREYMGKKGWTLAESPDNRMENPLDTGYRDIQMLWKNSEGHVAELQINTLQMIKAKQGDGHRIYEDYRVVAESITKQNRKPTPDEERKLTSMRDQMKKLYESAWR